MMKMSQPERVWKHGEFYLPYMPALPNMWQEYIRRDLFDAEADKRVYLDSEAIRLREEYNSIWQPLMDEAATIARLRSELDPGAVEALSAYQQADMDGIMVLVSRQAVEECLPVLHALKSRKEQ